MQIFTAHECMRPFDAAVFHAVKRAGRVSKESLNNYGALATYIAAKIPRKYRDVLLQEDLQFAAMCSMVRLSDLGILSENCVVTGKPHRKVPDVHWPVKPPVHELCAFEQWMYTQLSGGYKLDHDDALKNLAERLPQYFLTELAYPVDEMGRSWMRLIMNGYVDGYHVAAQLTQAENRAV